MTDEPRQKRHVSDETRKRISEATKGRKKTQDHKDKISLVHSGKPKSDEHKKKISEAMKTHWNSRRDQSARLTNIN